MVIVVGCRVARTGLRQHCSIRCGCLWRQRASLPPVGWRRTGSASWIFSTLRRCDTRTVSLRCLLVDDSREFLMSAADLLTLQGVSVVGQASNSMTAVDLAATLRPDLTLIDVELGDEDGVALARRLDGAGTGGHVILISVRNRDELAELIADSGAIGFIHKDALDSELIRKVIGDVS